MASRIKRAVPVSVSDVLDGHVQLDLDWLDRVREYLHGYLGQLQVGGQMVQFLRHRGYRCRPRRACSRSGTRSAAGAPPLPGLITSRWCR